MVASRYNIYHDDCFNVMEQLRKQKKKVDMVLCDLPYNNSRNNWKKDYIDLSRLWEYYNDIVKEDGVIVLFSQGRFTAKLMMSNLEDFRYSLIWDKVLPSGFLNANRMPLRVHEDICVFYRKPPKYNPQKKKGNPNNAKGKLKDGLQYINNSYGDFKNVDNTEELGNMKHPKSILQFQKPHPSTIKHPNEKSIELLEFLIKSFSMPGDLIMDNCMGGGSTGVACLKTGRRFLGIEKVLKYYDIADDRLKETLKLVG